MCMVTHARASSRNPSDVGTGSGRAQMGTGPAALALFETQNTVCVHRATEGGWACTWHRMVPHSTNGQSECSQVTSLLCGHEQAGELLLAPPLQSAAPLLPARRRGAGLAVSDLLFGPLPQAGEDTETAAWQASTLLQCAGSQMITTIPDRESNHCKYASSHIFPYTSLSPVQSHPAGPAGTTLSCLQTFAATGAIAGRVGGHRRAPAAAAPGGGV